VIGAGSRICNFQKPKHVQLTAIDIAPDMVEKAIKKIDDPAVKISLGIFKIFITLLILLI
jgi:ubiquinone/menaquinone biosynthesis C-methylase UbiE